MGSLQMGFHSNEEQIVQSGSWDGDSAIPALASPAGSLCWRRREADLPREPRILLRKIAWLPSDASAVLGAGTGVQEEGKPGGHRIRR